MSDAVVIIKTRLEKSPTDLREQLPRVVDVRRVLHGVRRDIRAVRNAHHGLPALLQPPRGCLEECAAADQLAQVLQIFRYFSQAGQIYIFQAGPASEIFRVRLPCPSNTSGPLARARRTSGAAVEANMHWLSTIWVSYTVIEWQVGTSRAT